ncbi:MAG: hypothetical protein QOF76_1871, partial [Solirubrobacteraceae bacterium]|nr:hypothetical protein [Solirubrobacteraceae bacterium]
MRVEIVDGRWLRVLGDGGDVVEVPLETIDGELDVVVSKKVKLPGPVLVPRDGGLARVQVRRTRGGRLEIRRQAVVTHPEVSKIRLDGSQLHLEFDPRGAGRLNARRRRDGLVVHGSGGALDLASLESGIWDLRVGRRRVGRHHDGIPNKAEAVALPAYAGAYPFLTRRNKH